MSRRCAWKPGNRENGAVAEQVGAEGEDGVRAQNGTLVLPHV